MMMEINEMKAEELFFWIFQIILIGMSAYISSLGHYGWGIFISFIAGANMSYVFYRTHEEMLNENG
jgi:hypothetical protein